MRQGGQIFGLASLMTIFCSLFLCVFAVLTLSTAEREQRFAELNARRAADYYEANAKAVEWASALNPDAVPEGGSVRFETPDGELMTLVAEVAKREGRLTVVRWQTVYSGDWQPDERVEVWNGAAPGELTASGVF